MLRYEIPYAGGATIPKIIHQTYKSRDLPAALQQNVDALRKANPNWEYRFYDDQDAKDFIVNTYGHQMLACYERISPAYAASKADFFRYLLVYACGGVYLDIKSTFTIPIDEVVLPDDQYILSSWCNGPGEAYESFGLHDQVRHIPRGEYQQWHVIGCAGHPFLREVIKTVIHNIEDYKPWIHGVGRKGVLALTGPIAYTLAIHPLITLYNHRKVDTHDTLGLKYSIFKLSNSHLKFYSAPHYTTLNESIVIQRGAARLGASLYTGLRELRQKLSQFNETIKRSIGVSDGGPGD